MHGMGAIACLCVTIDCAKEAVSDHPEVFSQNFQWVWWIAAVGWAIVSLRFIGEWWNA